MKPSIWSLIFYFLIVSPPQALAAIPSSLCPKGQHWVKAYHRSAYVRADGVRFSASDVQAHCRINPPSFALWSERLSDKPSLRWLKNGEKLRPWSVEERERVLEALSELPPTLIIDSVKALYRLQKSLAYGENPAAGESGEIGLYDLAFNSKTNLPRVLSHEFAHELYRQFSDAEKEQYRVTAEWLLIKNNRTPGVYQLVPARDDKNFVESDGPESMTEDFSNNVEYFLFAPEILKQKTPRVHDWIKKKFGDNFKLGRGSK